MNDSEKIIRFLTYLNNRLEEKGEPLESSPFNLEHQTYLTLIATESGIDKNEIISIRNKCAARGYIKCLTLDNTVWVLTKEGQQKVLDAVEGGSNMNRIGSHINIGSIHNTNSNLQVGDGNIQNISNSINQLVELIESSDANKQDKDEAKSLLQKFIEHPLVCAILGGLSSKLPM